MSATFLDLRFRSPAPCAGEGGAWNGRGRDGGGGAAGA